MVVTLVQYMNASQIKTQITKGGFWIGLHDRQFEGTFKWVDDTPLNYDFWSKPQPDNNVNKEPCHGQDCVQLWKRPRSTPLWKWDDDYCYKKKPFVCQYENRCATA
ncbi:C-type lectin domain family 19 member A-like [Glandiceps talaboti]